jgi:sigma-E factor negative regulatory protein RseB
VRCYYPDAKIVRVEPRTFRNVFPSLSREQQQVLTQFYDFRRGETGRVAGLEAQTYVFEPRDGLRYGHRFWVDVATGLLLKARIVDEKGEVVEQFAFIDLAIGARIDRDMVKPSWAGTPADWQLRQGGSAGDAVPHDTGWVVNRVPPGFAKISEGFRMLRGKRDPVAHLVFSDGLVAVSVFVEPLSTAPSHAGFMQQGGLNVYTLRLGDHLVTVLGETPARTVQQIAYSVARR